MKLYYRDITRFKYLVTDDFWHQTELLGCQASAPLIFLDDDGLLRIIAGYMWDGPSGPTIDSPEGMRGSLVHDALYELMRRGVLEQKYREYADKLFKEIILQDGMSETRAHLWFDAVRDFAAGAAHFGTQPADKIICVGKE
jgi:hypothetical protein